MTRLAPLLLALLLAVPASRSTVEPPGPRPVVVASATSVRLSIGAPEVVGPSGVPQPTGAVGTVALGGLATWHHAPPGHAAAGPLLRVGDWRGSWVTVTGPTGATVVVQLLDACQCGDRNGHDTLLDLSRTDFERLAPPSVGVIEVSVELGGIALPATDTLP